MVKNRKLAKSISDAAWSTFRQWLEYFGRKYEKVTVAVPPHNTSQNCSNCGEKVKKSLSTRTQMVPVPMSVEANVDPEEAFVASLSSCHMLWFLSVAAKKRYVVDSYIDEAVGVMEKDEKGKLAMTKVILRPQVHFSGENQPSDRARQKMHQLAHENCFIANSVKTEVLVESA